MRKPKALQPGDMVGIVSPAGVTEAATMARGVALFEARGYRVVVGDHALNTLPDYSYLAGADADRAGDLNALFARPDIAAVFCAAGGYGSMRLFDRLDWDTIAANPKLFIGYSDITSLHLGVTQRGQMNTIYGPMLRTLEKSDPETAEWLWRLLETPEPLGTLPTRSAPVQTLVPGVVEGELAGGCLCLLAHACGSACAPDFRGKLVLIEDVGEAVYRVDRDLTQLRNAGCLDEAAGFVVGTVTGWKEQEPEGSVNALERLWRDFFLPLGKPAITGFPFGHEPNPLALPLGVRARLDADAGTLTLLEAATQR